MKVSDGLPSDAQSERKCCSFDLLGGACRFGAAKCQFAHTNEFSPSFLEGSPSEKEQLARAMRELDRPHCRFFITSVCRYGAKCRFAHVVTRLNLSHDLRESIRKMEWIDQSGFEKVAPVEWKDCVLKGDLRDSDDGDYVQCNSRLADAAKSGN